MNLRRYLEITNHMARVEREWKAQKVCTFREFNRELDTADSINGIFIWAHSKKGLRYWIEFQKEYERRAKINNDFFKPIGCFD